MKKVLCLLLFNACFLVNGYTQNLDSLQSLWQNVNLSDSTRVSAYRDFLQLGFLYSRPDSAMVLAEALHQFAEARDYPAAAAQAYRIQGIANAIMGNYPAAETCFRQSLEIFEKINDKPGTANNLKNLGNINVFQGNQPAALDYTRRALKIYEALQDQEGIAATLDNLGHLYFEQENYDRALSYAQRSLGIYEQLGDKASIAGRLSNLGSIYWGLESYEQALDYNQRALDLYQEFNNKQGVAQILSNNGAIYLKLGDSEQAMNNARKALALNRALGDSKNAAGNLINIGTVHIIQNNLMRARENCEEGRRLAVEIGVMEHEKNACKCLYDVYKALGENDQALEFLERKQVLEDSLKAQETAEKLQQMEFEKVMLQDSIAKAEEARLIREAHEAEMRKEENTRNWTMAGGVMALLLAGGFYSRWRYVRKSRDIISKEKDRSENLLLNILPAEIAEELKENGRAEARDFDLVSILFTDFKGFTELSSKLHASELVNEINQCFEAFDSIIEKHGIEKIKTIGDAYMAAGGLPVPTDDSVKNTVLAALEMQDFIEKRHEIKDKRQEPSFRMRVGIHTGPVVAGIVGVKKFQYDIWGDTVNTASRMESSGEVGKVNISQSTYELLKEDPQFKFESRGKIEVKGKGEMEMLFVSLNNGEDDA